MNRAEFFAIRVRTSEFIGSLSFRLASPPYHSTDLPRISRRRHKPEDILFLGLLLTGISLHHVTSFPNTKSINELGNTTREALIRCTLEEYFTISRFCRTGRTKAKSATALILKVLEAAEQIIRGLNAPEQLSAVYAVVQYVDGFQTQRVASQEVAASLQRHTY